MIFLKIFCYIVASYGICNVMIMGSGPFRILEHMRSIASQISEHFGEMFNCFQCLPFNVGMVLSLLNFFFLPSIMLTPFNIILENTGLWPISVFMDGALTSACCYLLYRIDNWLTVNSLVYEENEAKNNDIVAEDITKRNEY